MSSIFIPMIIFKKQLLESNIVCILLDVFHTITLGIMISVIWTFAFSFFSAGN
jgi:hypothetical protein